MKKVVAVLLIMMICGVALVAQDQEDGRASTVEDVFLRQQIEMQILRSQARSTDRETKLLALDTVSEMAANGEVEGSDELFAIIQTLATEGTSNEVRSAGRVINNFPVVRARAAALLGEVGGEQAQGVLLTIVRDDPEPMVLSEAIYALGQIGPLDNADQVADHIVFTLTRENAKISPDNNLAMATLLALQELFSAGMEFESTDQLADTVGLILDISTNYRYITIVRNRALDVLESLMGQ